MIHHLFVSNMLVNYTERWSHPRRPPGVYMATSSLFCSWQKIINENKTEHIFYNKNKKKKYSTGILILLKVHLIIIKYIIKLFWHATCDHGTGRIFQKLNPHLYFWANSTSSAFTNLEKQSSMDITITNCNEIVKGTKVLHHYHCVKW